MTGWDFFQALLLLFKNNHACTTQQIFYTERLCPKAQTLNLLHVYTTYSSQKRCPFHIPSIEKWYPFHIPYLELCIPFYCCNALLFKCVVPENIHTTPTEGICCMTPPPLWIFQNWPPKFAPLPTRISKIFAHPLEILLSLIEVNKEVVLFTRMPNFVSFMYFLLNCITDKRIPYANSLCTQVTDKFCAFHVIFVEFYDSANEMQGRVGNTTVLFSHTMSRRKQHLKKYNYM